MKKSIWKYPLGSDETKLIIPKGAEILCVQVQDGTPCLWVKVDPSQEREERDFIIYGTGHPITELVKEKYTGTFQLNNGALVFHLFEMLF